MLCSRCKVDKARSCFGPTADRYPNQRECKPCSRNRVMRFKHGIDNDQKTVIADAQGGCRVCGHPEPSPKGWVVDHDRSCCPTDKSCPKCRRGVICQWCNMVLGNAFDRPSILRAAADYLEMLRGCSWHMPVACAPRICGKETPSNATHVQDGRDGTYVEGSPLQICLTFSDAHEMTDAK